MQIEISAEVVIDTREGSLPSTDSTKITKVIEATSRREAANLLVAEVMKVGVWASLAGAALIYVPAARVRRIIFDERWLNADTEPKRRRPLTDAERAKLYRQRHPDKTREANRKRMARARAKAKLQQKDS